MNAHQNLYNKWADCIEAKAAEGKRAEAAEAQRDALLEALKRIANMSYDVTIKDIARAAIAKAEAAK